MIQYNIDMIGRGRSRPHFGRATSWQRQAFTLAALLAIFLQAFVVQTHIHTPVMAISAGLDDDGGAVHEHAASASDHQRVCVICQVLSSSGSATLPSTAVLAVAKLTSLAAGVALAMAPRVHTHSWRSRAPPSIL